MCRFYLRLYDGSVCRICPVGVCVTNLLSILACLIICISLGTLSGDFICVCVQMLWIWLFAEVLSGSAWPIYDLRLHDESVWLVCVTNVMNLAVCRGPIGVFVTNLWFTSVWIVCVTSLCDKCYASGCVPKSNRGLWPIYFSFSRVLLSELCLKIW